MGRKIRRKRDFEKVILAEVRRALPRRGEEAEFYTGVENLGWLLYVLSNRRSMPPGALLEILDKLDPAIDWAYGWVGAWRDIAARIRFGGK